MVMLRSLKELRGYTIHATDGNIGKAHDLYFDDEHWVLRYLVVDTGGWLSGRRVLISPVALGQPDWQAHWFPVLLTKTQVEHSPDIDTDRPVSRQQEHALHSYYRWPIYWAHSPLVSAGTPLVMPPETLHPEKSEEEASGEEDQGDVHLRSIREVIGYNIHARDGEIGHVEDFIADDDTWVIRYLVVDTRKVLPGKKVLVSPQWIERVSWRASEVYMDLAQESIRNHPEYDPSEPVNRAYEERLYDYYGRPKYWVTDR
jgi:hypothetical protein